MKVYTLAELTEFLHVLNATCDVRVPIRFSDGTRMLGVLDEGELALEGGVIPRKLTEVFLPQLAETITKRPVSFKSLCVVGWSAADLRCLEFTDRFFKEPFYDDAYFARRQNAVIVGLSGYCGAKQEFMEIAGSICDLEFIFDRMHYYVVAYSDRGHKLLPQLVGGTPVATTVFEGLRRQKIEDETEKLLDRASQLLLENKIPEAFWQNIANRCITCTGCNLVCPTCTCFDVFDRKITKEQIKRLRVWDSCQLEGFAREGSGHNPLAQQKERVRRRITHKLLTDIIRYGHRTCFNCGRCDNVCPTGIGIKSVCREMLDWVK